MGDWVIGRSSRREMASVCQFGNSLKYGGSFLLRVADLSFETSLQALSGLEFQLTILEESKQFISSEL
jgi:hypothetical protein